MGDEIAKQPSWEERQEIVRKKVEDALGDNTTEAALKDAAEAEKIAQEHNDLVDWYTEAYDAAVLSFNGDYDFDTKIQSAARSAVRDAEPEKFRRLRELEKQINTRNAKHQALANAAHASVVEANLKNTLLWA